MDRNVELKRYAGAFVYFLLKRLERAHLDTVCSIVLFGSVAQNRAGKNSDVDILIDVKFSSSRARKFRQIIEKLKDEFLLSNEGLWYKERGVYNELSPVVGNLDQWQEMKKSLSASGVVLYGPYREGFSRKGLRHGIIFYWETKGKGRGAFLNKLYGYTVKGKRYQGAISKFSGTKIGKSAALIPAEHLAEFSAILAHYRINYRAIEVFT